MTVEMADRVRSPVKPGMMGMADQVGHDGESSLSYRDENGLQSPRIRGD